MIAAAWCGMSLTLVGGLATAMSNDMAVPAGFEGLMQSAFFVGSIAMALLTSAQVKRIGARRAGLAAMAIGVLGAFITGVPSFWMVVLGRFLAGASVAGTLIFCTNVFDKAFPSKQSSLLALFHAILAGAATAGFFVARPIASIAGGWGGVFWLVGLIGLIALLALATISLPDLSVAKTESKYVSKFNREESLSLMDLLRNQSFLATIAVLLAYVAAEQTCTAFIATFAENTLGWTAAEATQLAGLFWIGIIVGRLASGALARLLAPEKQVTMGAAVMGAALVMLALVPVKELIVPWVFLAGFAGGPIVPHIFARCSEMVDGKSKSLVFSTCAIVCCIGGALGPIAMGLIAQERSLADGFWLFGGVMVTAVALVHRSDAKA